MLNLYLVANVRGMTQDFVDYAGTSVVSEFLTLNQYELIIESLRMLGFEVGSYFDENEFIRDCIESYSFRSTGKQALVINTAQKGTAIGRKSLIPAFCDLNGLWHTNSNAYVVSLTRNKFHCDSILKAHSFPSPQNFIFFPSGEWLLDKKPLFGEKVIAKLNGETSSIGLTKDNVFIFDESKEDFIKTLSQSYGQPVIVQAFIEGYEVEVSVVNDGIACEVVLPVGISINGSKKLDEAILDYEARKNLAFGFYNYRDYCPSTSFKLEECAKQAIKVLGIEGFGRVDFRIDSSGNFSITDVAANPHLTKGMSFNYAFQENGMNYNDMLEALILITVARYKNKSQKIST